MEEIIKIKELMMEDRPNNWDSLPDIDLYMDQVVSYLPRQTVGGKAPVMTSAMINNYVKDELLPRACGKRYHKEHLVYLTVIGLLKNVLTVKDMKLLLDHEIRDGNEQEFYANFLSHVDEAFSGTNLGLDENLTREQLSEAALSLALTSCAAKTACEHLLTVIRANEPEQDSKGKKETSKKDKNNDK